jgi:hypothetical protein
MGLQVVWHWRPTARAVGCILPPLRGYWGDPTAL